MREQDNPTPRLRQCLENERTAGIDALDYTLTVRSGIRFHPRLDDGQSYVLVEDAIRKKYFRLGEFEYKVVARLDGQRNGHALVGQLAEETETEADDLQDRVREIHRWLVASNLAFCPQVDSGQRLTQQADRLAEGRWLGTLNPISFKVSLFNPDPLLQRLTPLVAWVFTGWFFVVWVLVALLASWQWAASGDRLEGSTELIFSHYGWIWLLVAWSSLKVVHELAHGVACRKYGGDVPEAGILFLLFTPMAYVNVTSMWQFQNRWQRMVVSAAGMYVELFLAFIAVIVWANTSGWVSQLAFDFMLMASITTLLFNANPLMRFDGYFLLSDLIKIPNLYAKGTRWFQDYMKATVLGVQDSTQRPPDREAFAVRIYGCLAFIWKVLIGIGLVLAASVLFQGAGLVLSGIAVLMWYGVPVFRQVNDWKKGAWAKHIHKRRVGWWFAGTVAALGALFWVVQAPAIKSAPAVVQFINEQVIRARVSGLVQEIAVSDGQSVVAGQVLMRLSNPELENEVFALERRLEESEIQIKIYRDQQDHASVQAESENRVQLAKQLAEKQSEQDGLVVRAPINGFVYCHGLSNRLGSYVHQGDVLLYAARDQESEVVVSVDQRDFDATSWRPNSQLSVMLPGRSLFSATLKDVDPVASVVPSHPSLCANAGGLLAVRMAGDGSGEVEWLHPRFDVRLTIPKAKRAGLRAGQRGRVFYRAARQSLGAYFFLAARDWLHAKWALLKTE